MRTIYSEPLPPKFYQIFDVALFVVYKFNLKINKNMLPLVTTAQFGKVGFIVICIQSGTTYVCSLTIKFAINRAKRIIKWRIRPYMQSLCLFGIWVPIQMDKLCSLIICDIPQSHNHPTLNPLNKNSRELCIVYDISGMCMHMQWNTLYIVTRVCTKLIWNYTSKYLNAFYIIHQTRF